MRFHPFIAFPLSLLAAACSSSQFNSLIEARAEAREWEGKGEQITISWTERERITKYETVVLSVEEYEREANRNSKAAFAYATDLLAKRDEWAERVVSSMRLAEGFRDHPDFKKSSEWNQTRYFGRVYGLFPCKPTRQIMCVTEEKIAGRLPPKTRQVAKRVWDDVELELNFAKRDCFIEKETQQFVCWYLDVSGQQFNAQNEREAKALRASITSRKKYRYFRY